MSSSAAGVDASGFLALVCRHAPTATLLDTQHTADGDGVASTQALLPRDAVGSMADLLEELGALAACALRAQTHVRVRVQLRRG
jgi:hypothetical protein